MTRTADFSKMARNVVSSEAHRLLSLATMARIWSWCIPILLLFVLATGCRGEAPATDESAATAETAEEGSEEDRRITPLREALDEIQPAIPIYAGASMRNPRGNQEGRFELITDDPFPMVWHFYVLYFEQYRGWDHPAPYPRPDDSMRRLRLDLHEVMVDPFVPGSGLPEDAPQLSIDIRELPSGRGTAIEYRIGESAKPAVEMEEPEAVTLE